jgi:hypothetical protein
LEEEDGSALKPDPELVNVFENRLEIQSVLDLLANNDNEWMTIATKLQFQRLSALIDK